MKTTIILTSLLASSYLAQAAVVQTFTLYDGDRVDNATGYTVSTTTDGNDFLYTIVGSGDLDGLGMSDDDVTIVIRQSAVSGSFSGASLGTTPVAVTDVINRLGGNIADDNTFIFEIDSLSYTRGEGFTNSITFDGFDEITVVGSSGGAAHAGFTGSIDTTETAWAGVLGAAIALGGVDVAQITSNGTASTTGFRFLDFNVTLDDSTVLIPEPSSTALLGLGGLALIMRRRRA